jgi:tight adherence protein C
MKPDAAVLAGGVAIGAAVFLAVISIRPAGPKTGGIQGALSAIEKRYARAPAAVERAAEEAALGVPVFFLTAARRLTPASSLSKLQRRLDLAGNPPRWSPDRVLAMKGLCAAAAVLLGVLNGIHDPTIGILLALGGGLAGFYIPNVLVYNSGIKRQEAIQLLLPDSLDMLTVCVEAGLGFDAALAQVARHTDGPLAADFARVLQEMQIGKSRSEALRSLADRTTVPELRTFVSALVQASELGLAIANVLRDQAKEMRGRRRQRAEEAAQKLPVKILFPLITCLFPALMIIVVGPGAISVVHSLFGHGAGAP